MTTEPPLRRLIRRYAQPGEVMWIGARPARRAPIAELDRAEITHAGLAEDHLPRPGKRAVTLIQWEHLLAIAALAGRETVTPDLLRRNVAVAGFNLAALRGREFRPGTALLKGTGPCAPCSRMEEALGQGGYAAMRGHGGFAAEVIEQGAVGLGDALTQLD